jgi:glycosyltransferase involved in cell wall biosynthesis
MKICHIADTVPMLQKGCAGAEWAAERFIREQGNVADVFLITSKVTQDSPVSDLKFYEVPIKFKGLSTNLHLGLYPFNKMVYNNVKKILEKEQPDIVHLHNFKFFGFSAIKAAKELGIKVVFSVYDYWMFCPLSSLYIKHQQKICYEYHSRKCTRCFGLPGNVFSLRKGTFEKNAKMIDWFFVISQDSKNILTDNNIPANKISISSLVLDTPEIPEVEKIPKTILYVGWFVPHKGLDILIKGLSGTGYRLYAAGILDADPSYVKKCINLAKELNVEMEVLGPLPHAKIIEYIKKYEYLAVPSQWRIPLPTIMMEGLSVGTKVIGSNVGSIRDHLPKENIFNNENEIKNCLETAKFIKKRFDNRKIVNGIIDIYKLLLST